MTQYRQGTNLWFHPQTSREVCQALEKAYAARKRVRLWLGDTATGRAWAEENDVIGRLGRSTGTIKVPLLVADGDDGGPALLDHCIVRIDTVTRRASRPGEPRTRDVGETLYRHPSFHTGDWSVTGSDLKDYAEVVLHDGAVHARFKRAGTASRYIDFMQGVTYRF